MKKKIIIAIITSGFLASGCKYDNEEELYGAINCSTSSVTYSSTITGIINRYNCLSCHGTPLSSNAPYSLEGYANVKARVNDGRLFGAINHENGFAAMPEGQPKMNQCDIIKVKAWIDAGAPNN